MSAETLYYDIISGRAGPLAAPMRWALSAISVGYAQAVSMRNRRFDGGALEIVSLCVPVISIGNITTGGTGKTPLVIDFVERLLRRGRKPAVVSRGYKSRPGELGDELKITSQRLPQAVCIATADRVAGGQEAIRRGADTIVLDDGFQHRRLARDLDVVVVDATNPFGFGYVLPRGRLREPIGQLRRADLIVVSRVDQVDPPELERLSARLAALAPGAPLIKCRHRPMGLVDLSGRKCQETYRRAVVFAAIGNPQAFVGTLEQMDIEAVACLWWPDHHSYTARDVAKLVAAAGGVEHDVVLTTHKDAVKLGGLDVTRLEPLRIVGIDIEFLDGADSIVDAHLESVLTPGQDGSCRRDPPKGHA